MQTDKVRQAISDPSSVETFDPVNKPPSRPAVKTQQNQSASEATSGTPPGLARRLGAAFYDLLLLAAVLLLAAIPFVLIVGDTSQHSSTRFGFQLYLLSVIFLYYGWFWTRGGQTLGMLTWKLKLVASDNDKVTWRHALKRFAAAGLSLACLGLGFLWILFDRNKLAWHDRLSNTRLIRADLTVPRERRP